MFPLGDQNEPGRGLAWVTLTIIAINVAVFVLLQSSPAFTYGYSAVPAEIMTGTDITRDVRVNLGGESYAIPHFPGPEPIQLTLLSSIFMHGGWLHLLGNMLFLFIFGDNVEHFLGRGLYLAFYLAAGFVASAAHILSDSNSIVPSLGASGAISGVLGAYLVLFPGNQVLVFMFRLLITVPAIVAIGMWAAFQFINGFGAIVATEETAGGVAYMAHIGGFVAGVVAGFLFRGMRGGARPAPRYA